MTSPRPRLLIIGSPRRDERGHRPKDLVRADRTFVLATRSGCPLPWESVRRLLHFVASPMDPAAVQEALGPHRALLSLTLRPLSKDLDASERAMRNANDALLLGRLPRAAPLGVGPIAGAWAGAVAALVGDAPLRLVIPDVGSLDSETWAVLVPLMQALPALELVIQRGAAPSDDPLTKRVAEVGDWELGWIESVPAVDLVTVRPGGEALWTDDAVKAVRDQPLDPALDDELEARAAALLEQNGALSAAERRIVANAIRAAFSAHGFPTVVWLGKRFIALAESGAIPPDAIDAELRLLIGIAARELGYFQPRAQRSHWLNELAYSQLEAARPHLEKASDRAYVCYHLSLRASRGGDAAGGLALADACLEEARKLLADRRPVFETFGFNARAYPRFREQALDDALADCLAALEASSAEVDVRHTPKGEILSARFNVLVNLARLAAIQGDRDRAAKMLIQAEETLTEIPYRRPFYSWFAPEVFIDDLDGSLAAFDRSFSRDDSVGWVPNYAGGRATWCGDLWYRQGEAAEALQRFRYASQIWFTGGGDVEDVLTSELNCAVAAFRAGDLNAARDYFLSVRRSPFGGADPALVAEVCAALAMVYGAQGDADQADAATKEALAAADSVQDEGVLARVLRSVAESHLLLGRPEEAREELARALSLLDASDGAPEDLLGVIGALLASGGPDRALLERAIQVCRQALEDPNAWWELPRIVDAMAALRGHDRASQLLEGDEVAAILALARQRRDCRHAVEQLSAVHAL